ncbi:MAG: ABC transporter ATP-binding protein [Lachnospiraceae bacterium]|nr:ABC transporter ATP-binding protein [Lachnospiraceae bacterium]MBR0087622.1 ABC transporter ATP-binding protein [Lachnospiraceae bacterium]
MSKLLECTNLTKKYGGLTALNRVSFTLDSGKMIGLLGPNGSGKTTFIKILAGLLVPDEGSIYIDGHAPGVESKKVVAYLPDNHFINSYMTVRQIIDYFKDFYEDFREERALKMLSELGISEDARLKSLSKGNKEKVALILIMSRDAKLYVLDEPIAGVDPATRDYIISTIINNYNPEASVIISTHLITDIESVLDEVIFIQNGEILLKEDVDTIRNEKNKSVDELFREVFRW